MNSMALHKQQETMTNCRRMEGEGGKGDFVSMSSIPRILPSKHGWRLQAFIPPSTPVTPLPHYPTTMVGNVVLNLLIAQERRRSGLRADPGGELWSTGEARQNTFTSKAMRLWSSVVKDGDEARMETSKAMRLWSSVVKDGDEARMEARNGRMTSTEGEKWSLGVAICPNHGGVRIAMGRRS
jgi:hypothetical protein